jgi:hypothetical protein
MRYELDRSSDIRSSHQNNMKHVNIILASLCVFRHYYHHTSSSLNTITLTSLPIIAFTIGWNCVANASSSIANFSNPAGFISSIWINICYVIKLKHEHDGERSDFTFWLLNSRLFPDSVLNKCRYIISVYIFPQYLHCQQSWLGRYIHTMKCLYNSKLSSSNYKYIRPADSTILSVYYNYYAWLNHSTFPSCPLFNIQYSIFNIQYSRVFNIQYSIFKSIQYSIFNIQYSIFNIQYSIFNIQYSIFNIQYSRVFNIQYSIFNIQYSIFNIQYSIFNIQYSIFNIQYSRVFNIQYSIFNIQYSIFNIQYSIFFLLLFIIIVVVSFF